MMLIPVEFKILAAGVLLSAALYGMHWIDATYYEGEIEQSVDAQKRLDADQCRNIQEITKGTNDALQHNLDAVNARLNRLLKQHPTACVPIASRTDVAEFGAKLPITNGITTDTLRQEAADAERARIAALKCFDFVHQERNMRN